jgi:hypothetical protein
MNRMTNHIRIAALLSMMLAGAAEVRAQAAAGARDAVERRTRIGDRLTIDARDGSATEGRLVSVTADALVLDSAGRKQSFTYGDIDRIRRRRNGIVLGAIIGTGAGVALGLPPKMLGDVEGGNGTAALLTVTAIGAGVGIALDAVLSLNRTVYRRSSRDVTFDVAPRTGGAAMRVIARW